MKVKVKINKAIILSCIALLGFIFCLGGCLADAQLSKLGNQFASASGSYADANHCIAGQTCNWIAENEVLVGIYNANPASWGGAVTWNFDLSGIDIANIDRAELQVSWPHYLGKGLHSPMSTGQGIVKINNNEIARLTTNYSSGLGDYFAHNPYIYYLNFPFAGNYLSLSTNVQLATTASTGWDAGELKLYIYEFNKTVKIVNGKFMFKNAEFMIKGMDYAPWILGTGPEPAHQPFPNENDDVTAKLTNAGKITVTDYNSNGKIEMGEVIQYDLETMKAAGVNTIRTYSSGVWHDKNLNGLIDAGENSQGDLPDWVYDKMLGFANANGMKVIIGYWVQEEDFQNPLVCNWSDLEVAKQAFGRIINKYKNNDAVLAWGIGNEVQGAFNHGWFSWGVDIKDYLNQLNDYARSLDINHPVIYAKYVGEDASFDNLNAEVISINSYIHTAQQLIDAGEFSIPAPAGKAYMLGEFGHDIEDADAQWNLAKQYAGGCFLEYNNIWWKIGTAFGIVTQFREKQADRFNKVQYLYTGRVTCIDSDNGLNYFLKGSANGKLLSLNGAVGTKTDACLDSNRLNEFTCNASNYVRSNVYNCTARLGKEYSCVDGACVKNEAIANQICTDTDNGINYTQKGITTGKFLSLSGGIGTKEDSCTAAGSLVEFTCNSSQYVISSTYNCTSKMGMGYYCLNGACVKGVTSQLGLAEEPLLAEELPSVKELALVEGNPEIPDAINANVGASPSRLFYEPFDSFDSIKANGGSVLYKNASIINYPWGNAINLTNGAYLNYTLNGNWPASGTNVTVEFWVKTDNSREERGFFDIGRLSGLNPNSMGIFQNQNIYAEIRNNNTGMTQVSTQSIENDEWNLVTATIEYFNNNTNLNNHYSFILRIYLNDLPFWEFGREYGGDTFATNLAGDFWIGRNYFYGPAYSNIDEFQIFNYAKSPAEIKADYFEMMNRTGQAFQSICSKDSDCGTSGYFGEAFCDAKNDKRVLKNYAFFNCFSPGTSRSHCSDWNSSMSILTCNATSMCKSGACKPICEDSDNGLNYFLKGSANGKLLSLNGAVGTKTDACLDSNRLNEFTCNASNYVRSNVYNCTARLGKEYSCVDGACVKNESMNQTCTDSDGGINFTKIGITTGKFLSLSGGIGTKEDSCTAAGSLIEFSCNSSQYVISSTYNCTSKMGMGYYCLNGACVK